MKFDRCRRYAVRRPAADYWRRVMPPTASLPLGRSLGYTGSMPSHKETEAAPSYSHAVPDSVKPKMTVESLNFFYGAMQALHGSQFDDGR